MGDRFKTVKSGDALNIPATTYNAMLAAAKAHAGQGPSLTVPQLSGPGGNLIPIKNTTGGTLPRFSILAIDQPLFTPSDNLLEFQNHIAFNGITPIDQTDHIAKWVVIAVPLKAGKIGPAVVHGLTPVKIDVVESSYQFAGPWEAPGRTDALQTTVLNWGARILWKESGTGMKWAIIRMSNPVWYLN